MPDQEPQGTDTEPQGSSAPQGAPDTTGKPDQSDDAQDDVDWKAEARKWQVRAKKDAARLESINAALSEKDQVAQDAQKALADAQVLALRYKTAYEHGLPPAVADRLRGSTPEEVAADAEALAALLKPVKQSTDAAAASGKGPSANGKAQMDPNDLLRRMAGR